MFLTQSELDIELALRALTDRWGKQADAGVITIQLVCPQVSNACLPCATCPLRCQGTKQASPFFS